MVDDIKHQSKDNRTRNAGEQDQESPLQPERGLGSGIHPDAQDAVLDGLTRLGALEVHGVGPLLAEDRIGQRPIGSIDQGPTIPGQGHAVRMGDLAAADGLLFEQPVDDLFRQILVNAVDRLGCWFPDQCEGLVGALVQLIGNSTEINEYLDAADHQADGERRDKHPAQDAVTESAFGLEKCPHGSVRNPVSPSGKPPAQNKRSRSS